MVSGSTGGRDQRAKCSFELGAQDFCHRADSLEGGENLRRETKQASSLTVSGAPRHSDVWIDFWNGKVEGEYRRTCWPRCMHCSKAPFHSMPPRMTKKGHRRKVSDRTMVGI